MASSRKPPSAEIAVGLSGGVDSVVLLHQLKQNSGAKLRAIHVHHGLSPNADAWVAFCRSLCKRLHVPLVVRKVSVRRAGKGLEAAARDARYAVFLKEKSEVIALAHNLDDQAETVLMNLLRGAGARGASGMPEHSKLGGKTLWRPLLGVPRSKIEAYAHGQRLEWIEDESNADQALTRNFIRRSVGPLLEKKFPQWKQSLARAAKHFARTELGKEDLLRSYLKSLGLKAPSEAKLIEMLKQLASSGKRTSVAHDGVDLRVYRGRLSVTQKKNDAKFESLEWRGEPSIKIPTLGGELRFRKARGKGIALDHQPLSVRLRSGGERLQLDPRRPRRTLKNLFQEAGVPPWQRERLPLLYSGTRLVWAPGLGIDARFQAAPGNQGLLPEWHSQPEHRLKPRQRLSSGACGG
jgi:tRNA(Ile)-lysidine synthase